MVTEIITHFIGLFRIWDEPLRTWVKPDGAGTNHSISLGDGHATHTLKGTIAVESAPSTPFFVPDPVPGSDPHLHAWRGSLHHLPDVPQAPLVSPPFAPVDAPTMDGGGGFGGGSAIVTTTTTDSVVTVVWQGADETVIDDHQVNMLIANVSYVDHIGTAPLPMPSDAPLAAMMAQDAATMPQNAPVLGLSDTQEVGVVKAFEDGLASGSVAQAHNLRQGTYTDGVLSSPDGSPVQLTLPVDSLNTTTPTANGVPLGQSIVMGHDIAGSAALIVDTSAAPVTQIVEGNAFHADLIIQSNVVQNIDYASMTASAMFSNSILTGNDTVHNTAHFEQFPIEISGGVTAAFGAQWNVQVVNGDFYDINAVTQQNVLINDTLYAGTPTSDHYYAVLGGNTQLNQASVIHDAPSYDLLIVLGNSYTANAIYQHNVLLNDTTTGVEVSASAGGANTITAGHDTVTNDAAIAEYGAQNWIPTTANIQALVHSLATNGDFAGSVPGLLTSGGVVNVEIVTGNYYNLNLIRQTNIVANSSVTLADLTKAGFQVPTNVIVGQDTLANSAAIVSAGPLGQQYVAGKPYETAMLVQSNIVTTHTAVSGGPAGALVPELVAFLDTGNAHDVLGPEALSQSTLPTMSAANQDVLAGHLH